MRQKQAPGAVILITSLISLSAGLTAQAQPQPRQVKMTLHGLTTFVDNGTNIWLLYPDLTVPSKLPRNWSLRPNDIVYHEVRIYSNKKPIWKDGGVDLSASIGTERPCHETSTRLYSFNVTRETAGRSFKLTLGSSNTPDQSTGRLTIPVLDDLLGSSSDDRLQIHPALLDYEDEASEILATRINLVGVTENQLTVVDWPDIARLGASERSMPHYVKWSGIVTGTVSLCYSDIEDSTETEIGCLSWEADGDMVLRIEHNPVSIAGNCKGGDKDFMGHYRLLASPETFSVLPIPLRIIDDGGADNAQCSPAELRYP